MGQLIQLWDADIDPDDPVNGYVPYSFIAPGHVGVINFSMTRDFGRRESVMTIPGMDSVLDGYGRAGGPMDRRDMPVGFRVFTNGDNDAAYDLLAAQVARGYPQRLVYQTDSGQLWFTVGSNPRIQQTLAATNSWGNGGYCDFTVTWRIRPDWWTRYSEVIDIWLPNEGTFDVANDEVFYNGGTTVITSAAQNFTLDATGVAGANLPTLPDYGPKIFIAGPCGGDAGFGVSSFTATVRDVNNAPQSVFFTVPYKLLTANDSVYMDFGQQAFVQNTNGTYLPFRPTKPNYQPHFFRIDPGVVNHCIISAAGPNAVHGGAITVDWRRKRA